jgi:hypothetical protein
LRLGLIKASKEHMETKKEEAAVKRKVMIKEERGTCCPVFKLINTTVQN